MISEAVLAVEYGASSEDVARTTHAHVSIPSFLCDVLSDTLLYQANIERGIQRGGYGSVVKAYPYVKLSWQYRDLT